MIELADGSKKKPHCFKVVCGRTGRHYAISADDERSRHEWILAIEKVYRTNNYTPAQLHAAYKIVLL